MGGGGEEGDAKEESMVGMRERERWGERRGRGREVFVEIADEWCVGACGSGVERGRGTAGNNTSLHLRRTLSRACRSTEHARVRGACRPGVALARILSQRAVHAAYHTTLHYTHARTRARAVYNPSPCFPGVVPPRPTSTRRRAHCRRTCRTRPACGAAGEPADCSWGSPSSCRSRGPPSCR
jgi:hypothetical protein